MTDLTESIAAKVRDSFAAQAMMTSLGARLTGLGAGRVEISAAADPAFGQQQGFAHAGVLFSLGDSAAGYAALTLMPEEMEVVTSEMKIHLLRPATGTALIARGRVIKPGRRMVISAADVFAHDGADGPEVQVATLLGTMVPVPR
jgi:uncharacterized protein (TIGR00369 family)